MNRHFSRVLLSLLSAVFLLTGCQSEIAAVTSTRATVGSSTAVPMSSSGLSPSISEPTASKEQGTVETTSPIPTPSTTVPTAPKPALTTPEGTFSTAPSTTVAASAVTTKPVPPSSVIVTTAPDRPTVVPPALSSGVIAYTRKACVLTAEPGDRTPIAELPEGVSLILEERGAENCLVAAVGKTGWIAAECLTVERPESALAKMESVGGIYYPNVGELVAIDAGHQDHAMHDKEPNAPGSDVMKAKLSSGTQGVATGIPEYKLNLTVALLLRDELIARGYSVLMIRESHRVNISNVERALIANGYEADAFVRIHANGSSDPDQVGSFAICQKPGNPSNGALYPESSRLMRLIGDEFCLATGVERLPDWETDTMTGINWAAVPVTILEMGYMSNAEEDRYMATDAFRQAAAAGIANGLERYFEED